MHYHHIRLPRTYGPDGDRFIFICFALFLYDFPLRFWRIFDVGQPKTGKQSLFSEAINLISKALKKHSGEQHSGGMWL
jgi:hypothetical protein